MVSQNEYTTIALLQEMRKDFGKINSMEAVRAFFDVYQDISLHFANENQVFTLWTPELVRLLGVELSMERPIRDIIQDVVNLHIYGGMQKGRVYCVQGSYGLMAWAGEQDLPPFRVICKTNTDYIRQLTGTDFFEACLYGEHVFADNGHFLGTIIITRDYPMPGYSMKDYRKEKNFISPTEKEMLLFMGRRAYNWVLRKIA